MSRIGKRPIKIPQGVEVSVDKDKINVKGPKGELSQKIHHKVKIEKNEDELKVKVNDPEDRRQKALWGLFASLINNMIIGVTEGFEKRLEINGVGYGAQLQGDKLILRVGYSHPVEFDLPNGIEAQIEKNIITISGIDKKLVGETAAQIRSVRKPEPYKGKGIKYIDEIIRRKAGKAAKTAEGGGGE